VIRRRSRTYWHYNAHAHGGCAGRAACTPACCCARTSFARHLRALRTLSRNTRTLTRTAIRTRRTQPRLARWRLPARLPHQSRAAPCAPRMPSLSCWHIRTRPLWRAAHRTLRAAHARIAKNRKISIGRQWRHSLGACSPTHGSSRHLRHVCAVATRTPPQSSLPRVLLSHQRIGAACALFRGASQIAWRQHSL